jgi:hypothetical protein
LMTNRAIYHDGWLACSRTSLPWETGGRTLKGLKTAPWELYNVEDDFSQADDLAKSNPAKLKELQDLFLVEAQKYDVLPLDPRMSERLDPSVRIAGTPPTSWTYYGNHVLLPEPIGPQLFPRACELIATVNIPTDGAEGVIACAGAFSAGWSLYVADGKPAFHYNVFELATATIQGSEPLPEGDVELKVEFQPDPTSKVGAGLLKLSVNGKVTGDGKLERTVFRHGLEPFEIGRDSITPVAPSYKDKGSFEFTGSIYNVQFKQK